MPKKIAAPKNLFIPHYPRVPRLSRDILRSYKGTSKTAFPAVFKVGIETLGTMKRRGFRLPFASVAYVSAFAGPSLSGAEAPLNQRFPNGFQKCPWGVYPRQNLLPFAHATSRRRRGC